MTLIDQLPPTADPDALYEAFEGWAQERGLTLYPHQEEALIEVRRQGGSGADQRADEEDRPGHPVPGSGGRRSDAEPGGSARQ